MMLHRSGNDDRVQPAAVNKLLRVGHSFDIWVERGHMCQTCLAHVADRFNVAVRKTFEVANQKRSPITASQHADRDLSFHIFRTDSLTLLKSGWSVSDAFQ